MNWSELAWRRRLALLGTAQALIDVTIERDQLRRENAIAEARGRELGKFDAMEKALDPDGPLLRQMLARGRAEGEQRWMQLAWDAVRELGFDTDGDPTPSARVGWESGEEFMRMIREARKDHDEAYDEGKRDGAQAVLDAVEALDPLTNGMWFIGTARAAARAAEKDAPRA